MFRMINKQNRAFSLVEVLIAIAVIVIGLAGVTGSLTFGVKASRHGDNVMRATNHARAILEAFHSNDLIDSATSFGGSGANANLPNDASQINDADPDERRIVLNALDPQDPEDDPFTQTMLTGLDPGPFRRNITIERFPGATAGSPEEHLAIVTVRIYWFEKGVEHNVTVSGVVPHNRDL